MIPETLTLILEIVGTVSFAISGAFVAIKAGLDVFGVAFVGMITAMGGGIIRDLLIGRTPPVVFTNFAMFAVAVMTAVAVFVIAYLCRDRFDSFRSKTEHINNFFDAIGLAAFSVMGTQAAFDTSFADNMFLAVALGMFTGVGGGIFRDVLTGSTPYIFKKHIYAVASIAGSAVYYATKIYTENAVIASVVAMVLVVAVRMLASYFRWSLPKLNVDATDKAPHKYYSEK